MVSLENPELKQLVEQFVAVRVIQMGGVDLSLFQFDPFLSWSLFFLNGDRTIYGRFGRASPQTKRSKVDSNPNHTLPGLVAALQKALEIHRSYGEDPDGMAAKLSGKTGSAPPWRTVESTPAAQNQHKNGRVQDGSADLCIHCHEVQRLTLDSYYLTQRPVPDSLLWVYPTPGLLGLKLSKDHCARVLSVREGSLADTAGIQAGDDLTALDLQPLLSVADVQWVLHQFPDEGGALRVDLRRGDEPLSTSLTLPSLWRRQDDFGWRYRVAGYAAWLYSGVTLEDHEEGIRVVGPSPGWFKGTNRRARQALRAGDLIGSVDGREGMTRSDYLAYLMREKKMGSTVRLQVRRQGKQQMVTFRLPESRPLLYGH